jgi:lipopolysaccharide/colanic/teichoic acid biosynthesis glycosyltransferase
MKLYPTIKCILDFVFALISLVIFLPLLIIIAIIVKLDSKGPIFYKQCRMGKNMKKFTIYKFRTMKEGARKKHLETGKSPSEYITRAGKYLRGPRLDELPQLINILKGEMSFVGPRADNVYKKDIKFIEKNPKRKERFKVKSGITCLERLAYVWPEKKKEILRKLPNTSHLENLDLKVIDNRLTLDLYYIDNVSFSVDLILVYYSFLLFLKK